MIKTGGNPLIYYNNLSDPDLVALSGGPDFITPVFDNDHSMRFTEGTVSANRNWTEMFRVLVNSINDDPEKTGPDVFFEIRIDAPDQNVPLIVGRQIVDYSNTAVGYLAKGINEFTIIDAKNIYVKTPTPGLKSYMRNIDDFYYGTWLADGQPYTLYEFDYTEPTGVVKYRSTLNPLASSDWTASLVVSSSVTTISTNAIAIPPAQLISLDAIPNPNNAVYKHIYGDEIRSQMPNMIEFQNCDHIRIYDLDLDGNASRMKVGGIYDDLGRQLRPDGIKLFNTDSVAIINVNAHHFALDGLEIKTTCDSITIKDCWFEYNGRQAMSWLGGTIIRASGCHFNYSGKTYVHGFGYLSSPPCAGLDIEPENGLSLSDGYFNLCEFKNNLGCEVNNTIGTSANTNDIHFNDCTFDDAVTNGRKNIWCHGDGFVFENCNINTNVYESGNGIDPGSEMQFIGCHFRDITTDGDIWDDGNYMVEINQASKVKFDNCDFLAAHSLTNMIKLGMSETACLIKSNWHEVKNCTFDYHFTGIPTSIFQGVKFKGRNVIKNTMNAPTFTPIGPSYLNLRTYQIGLIGSDNECEPSSLSLKGHVYHNMVPTNAVSPPIAIDVFEIGKKDAPFSSADGYAVYNIDEGAISIIQPTTKIHIGELSAFHVKTGGSLWGQDMLNEIYNNGCFVFSKNSFANLKNTQIQSSNSNSLLFVDNSLSSSFHPYWTPLVTIDPIWFGTYTASLPPATCIQGGNTNLPTGTFVCTPPSTIYENISTNGAFEIMYNVVPNGAAYDITYTPSGSNYSVSFDGNPITTNTITGVSDGYYLLKIINTNSGCIAFAFITVGNATPPCCEPENPINLNMFSNPTSINFSSLFGSTINNKAILIDGTFTVDQSLAFYNCTFLMQCDAKFIIEPGQTLTLNNCTLKAACNQMWDGIYASDPTSQIIIENLSILQDMENGVKVSNNAKIQATGSTYKDNYFSIQIQNNTLATTCIITNNIFRKESGLLSPHSTDFKPETGIFIADCNNISIGDISQVNSGNTFVDMWNGISIWSGKGVNYTNANIQLYYNSFIAIYGSVDTWDTYTFTTSRGWAVYSRNTNPNTNLKVKVKGDYSSSSVNFLNCDKGILLRNTSGEILNLKMNNTKLGIGLTECPGRSYKIYNNEILNTRNGIIKYGDESNSGFYACNNTLSLYNHPIPNLVTGSPPIGIISTYSGTTNIGTSVIQNNTIDIPTQTQAVGISMTGGSADYITGNTIHFGTTVGETDITVPELLGIYSNKCETPAIIGNVIDNNFGVTGNTNYVPGNNAGIYVNANINSRLQCNSINYTRWGMFGVGANGSTSDYTLTASNTMRCSSADFMLWALGSEGSFGQVGKFDPTANIKFDADNSFLGPTNLARVYRVTTCPASTNDQIVTTQAKLDATDPNSSGTPTGASACQVDIQNPSQPFTQTHNCSSITSVLANNTATIDYNHAMLVAENNIEYEDFDEGARRADEELVYAWLDAYGSIRASNPILDTFYLNRYSQIVGTIKQLDLQIAMLSDSTLMTDSATWAGSLLSAIQNNNNLGTGQVFEANAKWINGLYLHALAGGIDSIDAELYEDIETLANTCPYLGGNAVYRARTLMGMLRPGVHYDDLIICNGQGVYKNGISKLQQQLLDIANAQHEKLLEDKGVLVYPNPTHAQITIEYLIERNERLDIVIYDLVGNKLKSEQLKFNSNKSSIDLNGFSTGMYFYQIKSSLGKIYSGKLIIE